MDDIKTFEEKVNNECDRIQGQLENGLKFIGTWRDNWIEGATQSHEWDTEIIEELVEALEFIENRYLRYKSDEFGCAHGINRIVQHTLASVKKKLGGKNK